MNESTTQTASIVGEAARKFVNFAENGLNDMTISDESSLAKLATALNSGLAKITVSRVFAQIITGNFFNFT
jgi:hypothetical protein